MRFLPAALALCIGCGGSAGTASGQQVIFAGATIDVPNGRHAEVGRLPVIARINGGATDIVIRGHLSARRARQIERTARATYADFYRRFAPAAAATNKRAVDVCVFENTAAYRRFASSVFGHDVFTAVGFYMASHRLVLADLSIGIGNLRHEMIHPLLKDAYPALPDWLNEGVGSLYGGARYRGGRYRFTVNYRLRHLRRGIRRGVVPDLGELARSDYGDIHGPRERYFYATARYLLLHLERRGQLDRFVRELLGGDTGSERQLRLLRRYVDYDAFIRWSQKIRR